MGIPSTFWRWRWWIEFTPFVRGTFLNESLCWAIWPDFATAMTSQHQPIYIYIQREPKHMTRNHASGKYWWWQHTGWQRVNACWDIICIQIISQLALNKRHFLLCVWNVSFLFDGCNLESIYHIHRYVVHCMLFISFKFCWIKQRISHVNYTNSPRIAPEKNLMYNLPS